MNNLTPTEQRVMNNVTREKNPNVSLGDVLFALIASQVEEGTPVNATSAWARLGLTGVVVDGETVSIGEDTYEFVADVAKTTAPGNIAVDIQADTTASTGTLSMATQPTSGDTVTIGEKVYIFVPVGTDTADGEVSIGADVAGAQANLVAAINGTDDFNLPHPLVRAADFVANDLVITAVVGGTAGNSIATTETFTASGNAFAAATLGSGSDCTEENAAIALISAINANDTQGVGAEAYGVASIDLTANTAGSAGNDIQVSTTIANAGFSAAATNLTGGADGTVSTGIKFMIDESNLYVSVGPNTAADSNWRAIELGEISTGSGSGGD